MQGSKEQNSYSFQPRQLGSHLSLQKNIHVRGTIRRFLPRAPRSSILSKSHPDNPAIAENQTPAEKHEEQRKIRRLQIMMDMALSVLKQDPDLTLEEAAGMVANCKRAALAMFPGKELAFDLIYKPRLERVLMERFRLQ
jgi:hypothetical protein